MKLAEAEIERIVREVLARLGGAPAAVPAAAANGQGKAVTEAATLVLDARVVTLDDLSGRLDKQQSVTVPTNAVVTPAVRDYLRERKIRLVRRQATERVAKAAIRLVVGVTDTKYEPSEMLRPLSAQGIQIELAAGGSLTAVTESIVEQVKRDSTLGLVLTEQVAAVVCLANRQTGVRAAAAAKLGEVEGAIQQVGVNLLVINPRGQSGYALRQMVQRYSSGAWHACPEALKSRL
jgi:hypothetical protein